MMTAGHWDGPSVLRLGAGIAASTAPGAAPSIGAVVRFIQHVTGVNRYFLEMVATTFPAALAFVWLPGYDCPADGYHVTPGDPGGGTKGGVIEATWAEAVRRLVVAGTLARATNPQLSRVLWAGFWDGIGDQLPLGIDFLVFNGRMMTGAYGALLQSCLGLTGGSVDGIIGPVTLEAAADRDPATLIQALHGAHYAYLSTLDCWPEFHAGWSTRLCAARQIALALASGGAVLS